MKIGIISPYDISINGGVTDHIKNLASELKNQGNIVTVIAPQSTKKEAFNFDFISLGHSVPLKFGSTKAHVSLSFKMFFRIKKLFKKSVFDVVHIHEPLIPFVGIASIFFANTPIVATFHASFSPNWKFKFWGFLFKKWLTKIDTVICVSKTAANCISHYGFRTQPKIIPNGTNISRFYKNTKNNSENINILFVGRNEKRKGINLLLSAFKSINKKFNGVTLTLVGDGVKRLEGSYNEENSKFFDHMEGDELVKMYWEADIFCSPAIENESFGIVLLEAMASGLAVIASDIPGYKEVVKDYQNGILFSHGSYDSLLTNLEELLFNENLRLGISKKGQAYSKEYDWKKIAVRIQKTYVDIV